MSKSKKTVVVLNEEGKKIEVTDVGILGLFQPQKWDIDEEFSNNEALREYHKSKEGMFDT